MGKRDWELDWHIYLDLPDQVEDQLRQVGHLHRDGLFCEWMVVNRWEDELLGRQWWSDDLDQTLLLAQLPESQRRGGQTISEDWSLIEDDSQGGSATTVAQRDDPATRRNSALVEHGARVYLQGVFVSDDDHDPAHLEIHPLDSIAYALRPTAGGKWTVLSARPTSSSWPQGVVRWRVAAFTNASFHRVNDCGFVKKERTTVWYLDLPHDAMEPESVTLVSQASPGFWSSSQGRRVTGGGIKEVEVEPGPTGSPLELSSFPVDPRDGRRKLRVQVTMDRPDERDKGWVSGRFLRDFDRSVAVGPDSGPAVTADGPHVLDVFVRGKHNHEWCTASTTGSAGAVDNLGGDRPRAGGHRCWPHLLDVFVRGKGGDDLVHASSTARAGAAGSTRGRPGLGPGGDAGRRMCWTCSWRAGTATTCAPLLTARGGAAGSTWVVTWPRPRG